MTFNYSISYIKASALVLDYTNTKIGGVISPSFIKFLISYILPNSLET